MDSIRPIDYKKFESFLKYIGCKFKKQRGDHRVWERSDLIRPVIVRKLKDIPVFEIKSNLKTLKITNEQYLRILGQL